MVSSRFELVAAPAMAPAEDIITRTTVGPFVDTGAFTVPGPQRRRIYLSVETIRELAETAGIISAPGATEQQLAHAYAMGALDMTKERLGDDLVRILVRLAAHLDRSDAGDGVADGEGADEDGRGSYLSSLWRSHEAV